MNTNPTLTLKPDKSRQLYGRHPWVRASSLAKIAPELVAGTTVEIEDERGRWLGRGVYNNHSQIAVRLYSFHPEVQLDDAFFIQRLEAAIRLRERLDYLGPNAGCRLVFSEADGLSGLVVDRYGPYLVMQVTAFAIQARVRVISDYLMQRLKPEGILQRTDARMAGLEGILACEEILSGTVPEKGISIDDHGVQLHFDILGGQKTGLYLDQRENRIAAARLAKGQRALDVCCHVGGFGLAAGRLGSASHVTFVDSSAKSLEAARRNASDNNMSFVEFVEGDCFETLARMQAEGKKFGWISLDPPRFASSRRTVPTALQAYHRLNRLAISILEPGGILVTSSCSGNISRQQFLDMLGGVSRKSRREILVLENRGAAPDHPVRLACPETDYLKCVIACVE